MSCLYVFLYTRTMSVVIVILGFGVKITWVVCFLLL